MYNKKKIVLLVVIVLMFFGALGFLLNKVLFMGTGQGKGPAIKIEEGQKRHKRKKSTKQTENHNKNTNEETDEKSNETSTNNQESEEVDKEDSEQTVKNISEIQEKDRLTNLIEKIFAKKVRENWSGKYEGSYEEIRNDNQNEFIFYLYCTEKEADYLNGLMADTESFNKYWNNELKSFKEFTVFMSEYYLISASLKVKTPDGSANMLEMKNGKIEYNFAQTINRKGTSTSDTKEPEESQNQTPDVNTNSKAIND